jgi:Protein of unknown function (DUF2490)
MKYLSNKRFGLSRILKAYLFVILTVIKVNPILAQEQYEFWSKLDISKSVNDHWVLAMDAQYRRQSDYYAGDKNIFKYPLTTSVRAWVTYKLPKKWSLISSPIAHFKNETLKNSRGTLNTEYELRSMTGASKEYIMGKLNNTDRVLYELSFLNYNTPGYTLRHRYRLYNSFDYPILKINSTLALNYLLFNEVFFKTQKGVSSFDQNHLFNGFQWRHGTKDFDIGYQFTIQKNGSAYEHKNQLYIQLNIQFPPRNQKKV